MVGNSDNETKFPHKLLLANRKVVGKLLLISLSWY